MGACKNYPVSPSVVNSQSFLGRWLSGWRCLLPSPIDPWSSHGGRKELPSNLQIRSCRCVYIYARAVTFSERVGSDIDDTWHEGLRNQGFSALLPACLSLLTQLDAFLSKRSHRNQNLFPEASHNYQKLLFQRSPLFLCIWTHCGKSWVLYDCRSQNLHS